MHSEDHFSEEGLFGNQFSKSSFKFTERWKVRVPSHASVSKYHAKKNYANLWFILLKVTRGFRFQIRDRAEGGAGGALAPPLFCKNKNKLNKK